MQADLEYYQENGLSFVELMKANKNFQNPKILQQTIDYFKIDGNGTQFEPVHLLLDWNCVYKLFVGGI